MSLTRDFPLTLKALLLTLILGTALGVIWGRVHIGEVREALREDFTAKLESRALEYRIRLDNFVKFHHHAGGLLLSQKRFHDYLDAHPVTPGETILVHNTRPPWAPERSIQRTFMKSRFALLLDDRNEVREVYNRRGEGVPEALLTHAMVGKGIASDDESWIIFLEGALYLVSNHFIPHATPTRWKRLIMASPIDDAFLLASQGYTGGNDRVALVDGGTGLVLASGDPEQIPPGTDVSSLGELFLAGSEAFFDYGNSDVILQLALFAPMSDLEALSDHVARDALVEIAVVSFAFAGSFSLVLLWFIGNVQRFTVEMLDFSRQRLGIIPPTASKGGALNRMREQFQLMAEQIQEARRNETKYNLELVEANEKLQTTLDMVEQAHEHLVQSEKMAALGGLVAGVAHEINNPIGIGFTSMTHLESETRKTAALFREEQMTRRDLETFLEVAMETTRLAVTNLKRAAELVRSFKLLAVDQTSEERRLFGLKSYLEEVLLSLGPKFRNTPYTVQIECPDDLEINSFPGALSQIVSNLIINSVDHGFRDRERGAINIRVMRQEGMLTLTYQDDGCGMDEAAVKRIFEPFFTTARGRGGSGLGMHIVYNLVHQTFKGRIDCKSEPDAGTSFLITIPTQDEEAA